MWLQAEAMVGFFQCGKIPVTIIPAAIHCQLEFCMLGNIFMINKTANGHGACRRLFAHAKDKGIVEMPHHNSGPV